MSAIAALLACIIVVVACNYIFKNRGKKRGAVLEYSLLFPWLLPTILICYSYRTFFNSDAVWYVGNQNLYYAGKCTNIDCNGLHGDEAAILTANDQGVLLCDR